MPDLLRRSLRLLAGGVLVAGGLALGPGAGATGRAATPSTGFVATAAADGVRITTTLPNFVATDTPVDGGGPTAQALLDSVSTSTSFASAPYPGEAAAGAPSLVAGFTGAPVPTYPLLVSASYPSAPDAAIDQDGYRLAAHAEPGRAASTAFSGSGSTPPSVSAQSEATVVERDDGTVVAEAHAATTFAGIGGLELHGFRSDAKVTMGSDGSLEREASLQFGSLTVAGSIIGLAPGQLAIGDSGVPTGAATTALDALHAAGYDVTFLAAEETPDGVIGPGMKITTTQTVPVAERQGTVTIIIGRTFAAVTTTAGFGAAAPASAPTTLPSTDVSGGGVVATPARSATPLAPVSGGSAPAAPATVPTRRASVTAVAPVRFDFYWVLLVAGGVMLAGGEILRSLGMRLR